MVQVLCILQQYVLRVLLPYSTFAITIFCFLMFLWWWLMLSLDFELVLLNLLFLPLDWSQLTMPGIFFFNYWWSFKVPVKFSMHLFALEFFCLLIFSVGLSWLMIFWAAVSCVVCFCFISCYFCCKCVACYCHHHYRCCFCCC